MSDTSRLVDNRAKQEDGEAENGDDSNSTDEQKDMAGANPEKEAEAAALQQIAQVLISGCL